MSHIVGEVGERAKETNRCRSCCLNIKCNRMAWVNWLEFSVWLALLHKPFLFKLMRRSVGLFSCWFQFYPNVVWFLPKGLCGFVPVTRNFIRSCGSLQEKAIIITTSSLLSPIGLHLGNGLSSKTTVRSQHNGAYWHIFLKYGVRLKIFAAGKPSLRRLGQKSREKRSLKC